MAKHAPRLLAVEIALGLILFGSAGRVDLPWFWATLLIHGTLVQIAFLLMDPALRRERLRPKRGGRDRHFRRIAGPLIIAHLVIAGLDVGRFHWSPPLPPAIQGAGLATYSFGVLFIVWAMTWNRFFSPVVRIQAERGHHVISTGPYRFVRHPGYTGMLIAALTEGIALGSLWSIIPLIPFMAQIVRRTLIEDGILRRELDGYEGYVERVRFRLVPGLW
jgi:protein-S-isoprenylcysteine O-methyltransferase Ste14